MRFIIVFFILIAMELIAEYLGTAFNDERYIVVTWVFGIALTFDIIEMLMKIIIWRKTICKQ